MSWNKKWTEEKLFKLVEKYKGRLLKDFISEQQGAYVYATKNGLLKKVTKHMKRLGFGRDGYWTKDKLMEIAEKYKGKRVKDFATEQKGAYLFACKNGLLREATKDMKRVQLPRGFWVQSKDRCMKEAAKYEGRTEFCRKSGAAYNACLKNGWLEEACSHMKRNEHGYFYCVYIVLNRRKNLVYAGVTKDLFERRVKGHKRESNHTRSRIISRLKDTEFIKLTGYVYTDEEVGNIEKSTAEKYKAKGFKILNDSRNFGTIGCGKKKYSDEDILNEAKKYSTSSDFYRKSKKMHSAACQRGILHKACAHMQSPPARMNFWTKEECIKVAKRVSNLKELREEYAGALIQATRSGWKKEMYEIILDMRFKKNRKLVKSIKGIPKWAKKKNLIREKKLGIK
jgi:predicted GIY-YIG superfamily endonuclease